MALNIALGQLQKAAGPDQRVTASANVLLTGTNTSSPGVLDVGNARWTGAWDSSPTSATYGQRLAWLVSGTSPNAATAVVAGPALTDGVELVGSNSAVITGVGTEGNRIVVPRQTISATNIPGLNPATSVPIGSYAYWVSDEGLKARVNQGDSLRSPWFNAAASGKAAPDMIDGFNAVGLTQRASVEMVSEDIPAAAPLLASHLDPTGGPSRLAQITSLFTPTQIPFIDSANATTLTTTVRARFHDLTAWSAGVQADVKNGGLKRDLTGAFELNDTAFQSSEFADAFPQQGGKDVRTPIYYTQNTPSTSYLGFVFTPLVPGSTNNYYRGPSWHLLRNHYRLYKDITNLTTTPRIGARPSLPAVTGGGGNPFVDTINGNNSPDFDPKLSNNPAYDMARGDQYGSIVGPTKGMSRRIAPSLLPYINRVTMVLSLQTVPTTASPSTTPDGQPILDVHVVLTPYVVLHNPYSVELQLNDTTGDGYWGEINQRTIPFSQLVCAQTPSGNYYFSNRGGTPAVAPAAGTIHDRALSLLAAESNVNGVVYNQGLYYQIPTIVLAPGEVRVFSPNKPIPDNIKTNNKLKMSPNAYFSTGLFFDALNGYKTNYFGDSPAPVGCPIGVGGTIVPPATTLTDTDYLIRVPANMPISVAFTADTKNSIGNQIMRMSSESPLVPAGGDTTSNDPWVNCPPVTGGQTARNLAENVYTLYGTASNRSAIEQFKPTTATPASNFQIAVPTPILALDVYVKPADHPTVKGARPFITSNPMAVVFQTTSLGDWQNILGTIAGSAVQPNGFPAGASAVQPEWRLLGPNAWTTNEVIEVDAGGNGRAYWGPSKTGAGVQTTTIIDVPKTPMTSLAQFQHLMIANYAYEPYLAIGNSYSTPYTPLAMASPYLPASYLSTYPNTNPVVPIVNPKKNGATTKDWWMADLSYLSNDALWDRYFFSTLAPGFNGTGYYIPPASPPSPDLNINSRESIRDGWLSNTRQLPNTRVRPYISPLRTDAVRKTQLLDYKLAAANLIVNGSFNINSRSIDAWAAVLGGARKAAMPKIGGSTATVGNDTAIGRNIPSAGNARATSTSDTWNGFAQLTDTQIRALATSLVDQIKKRQTDSGTAPALRPFLSLGEFVNRKITLSTDMTLNQSGALQSAIDQSGINNAITGVTVDATSQTTFPFPSQGTGSSAAAAPGNLLQADILQQIGPFLSARSDTFTIRTYGESINPSTGIVQGRAWCEAVVQRLPDYIGGEAADTAPSALPAASPSVTFGRRFQVVSFRWLSPSDI